MEVTETYLNVDSKNEDSIELNFLFKRKDIVKGFALNQAIGLCLFTLKQIYAKESKDPDFDKNFNAYIRSFLEDETTLQ